MESAETEPLECDPHPTITVDTQTGENKHHVTTMASPETEAFESDAYATTAVGFDLQAVGSEGDVDWLASMKTEHLELDPQARASVDTAGAQAGGSEHKSFVVGSVEPKALECDPYARASVSTVGLQAGVSEHDDTTIVSAEKAALESNPDAVDGQAGGSEHDDTVMAAAETEAVGCDSAELEFEVSVEECTTNVSLEAQNVEETTSILILGDHEVSVTPIQHLEQEVSQNANMVSNHEGSFSSASPAGETGGDGTFQHIPIHNQEEIQGEEHVFDISEFDLSSHDVPMTGTFFGDHCMFPALDADKAEAWQGSEDDVIIMDGSCEHEGDQPGNRDAIPMGISSATVVNHDVAEKEVVEEKFVHKLPLQTSFETAPMDVVHGLNESSGMNDSRVQGHEKVGGHQRNDTDNEHAEGLAPVIVKGVKLPLEDVENPDAHLQGDAEVTSVSFIEKNLEQTMSSEIYNTNNSMEEVKNQGNLLSATHEDAAVHSVKFDHNMPGSSPGLGVEGTNSNTAANELALHLNTQDTLVVSRVETFKSHEESITQAFGNEENECIDSQSNERSACEQPVEVEKDSLLNERDFNNRSEAAFTAGNAELACALANSKQEENMPVVVLSSEISMEAVVPVADSLVQDKVMLNNKELKVGPVVSHMEVDKLHIEQVEKQIDDSLLTGVKSVEGSDGNVSDSRHSDGEETVEDRGEVVEDKLAGPEQEKEEINEQEELCPKSPVDTRPLQARIAEEATKQDLTTERTNIASCSDVKSVEESDGNVLNSRRSDGEESVEDRGEVVEDKVAGPEQEKEEINEQEELCLKPPVDSCPLLAGIAEETTNQDCTAERTNIASSSDADTAASSCSDFTPANESPEGLNNDEKPALQSLKPGEGKRIVGSLVGAALQSLKPGEVNKGKRSVGSPVGVDSLSKKQLEKHINYHKSPMLKGGNKLDSGIVLAKEDDNDDSDDEPEEELFDRKVHKAHKEGNAFGIGDLVWAKVRSHPWWPAQIFDPADASKSARKAKKFGRVLVAFFGDCTFAWLQQSQMIAFRPNFREKVKQTTLRIFCIAVEEALEEFCRRSELGLSCAHFKGSLHSTSSFPDANTGIRDGVRVKRHKDFGSSVQMFRPDKTLEFVKGVACSPLGAWCSTLKLAELRGHVYGLRTCMVASGGFDSAPRLSTIGTVPSHGSKLKRSFSSLEINDDADADAGGSSKKAKNMKDERHSDGKGLTEISKKPKKAGAGGRGSDVESKSVARKVVDASEGNKDSCAIKFKVSKKNRREGLSSSEVLPDTAPGRGVESEKSSDDGRETLLALAGSSVKILKRSSSKKNSSSLKKKVHRQTVRELKIQTNNEDSDSEAAASPRTEANAEDVFAVTSSLSEEKVSKAEVKRGKEKKKLVNATRSPVSSIDAEDLQEGTHQTNHSKLLKVGLRDETKKSKFSKTLKEVEMEKEELSNDKEAGKKEAVRKFSRVGDSIRKVAGELTGTSVAKNFEDSSAKSTGPGPTIKLKDFTVKLQASPTPKKAASKEFTEDVSLLQLRQDLELLANKTGGGSGKAVKHFKKGDQAGTPAGKTSPQWQNVPHKTQKSCVQELALAARKRKSEMVHDEVLAKLPKNSSTTGSQGHHASKAYIKGVEKPTEHRSFDKSLSHYSRRPALPASNVKGSSQRYDEKLSSHMPLGLFMRFPEDFPLPSESQLKATFVPFGPLQMSATRLYHDSASAQVVFKHGRDAESAMKHAKKNAMFGPVSVTYRLRHLSHSSKVESKTDTPSPSNVNSSTPVRRSYLAKEKVAGPSVAPENRAGDKEVGTSVTRNNAMDSGSEPTGDIQDKMMTLLRQVSVLVKPSPVGSDGT